MMKILLKLLMIALVFPVFPAGAAPAESSFATVQQSQFQVGNNWLWTYLQLDPKSKAWLPYYFERYTVTTVEASVITIEMSSASALPITSPAHHKMVLNFVLCAKAAADPRFRNFTVSFFTTSLGDGWQLVSATHPNLVFTEKFNCTAPAPHEQVIAGTYAIPDAGEASATFMLKRFTQQEASAYFLDQPRLQGVTATKLFEPREDFRIEFTSFCDRGLACQQK